MTTRLKGFSSQSIAKIAQLEKKIVPLISPQSSLDKNSAMQIALDIENKFMQFDGSIDEKHLLQMDEALYYYYVAFIQGEKKAVEHISKLVKQDVVKTLNKIFNNDREKVEEFFLLLQSKNDFENALIQLESYFAKTYKINIYKDDPSPCVDAQINEFDVIFIPSVLVYFYYQCVRHKLINKEEDYLPFLQQSISKMEDMSFCSNFYMDNCDILNLLLNNELQSGSEDLQVMPGMPAQTAYKIGLAYYFGTDLPHDIDKAGRWLSYASMVGHPAAIYARQLFIMDINSSAEDWESALIIPLFHAFKLAFNHDNGLVGVRFESRYSEDSDLSDKETLITDLLYNFLSVFLNAVKLGHRKTEDLLSYLLSSQVSEYLFDDVPLMKVMQAKLILSDIEKFKSYVANYAANEENPSQTFYSLALELLKEAYESGHCEQALEPLANLLISPQFNKKDLPLIEQAIGCRECADVAFKLGSYYWNMSGEKKDTALAEKWWSKAALLGSSLALFNMAISALDGRDLEKAAKYALKAVNSGAVMGYYILYRALLPKDPELAHTYLRLGAEYELPSCVKEYARLKKERKFKPLKFIQIVDKIASLSNKDPSACLFMQNVYIKGTLLPRDLHKAENFYRKGVSLTPAMAQYCPDYILEDHLDCAEDSFTYRVGVPFNRAHRFIANYSKRNPLKVESSNVLKDLVKKLYESLVLGTRVIEIDTLLGCIHDDLFSSYDVAIKYEHLEQADNESLFALSDTYLKDAANRLCSQTFRLGAIGNGTENSGAIPYSLMLEALLNNEHVNSLYEYIKGMIALRPMACKPDLHAAFKFFKRAANGGCEAAFILSEISFDMFLYHLENKFTDRSIESTISGFINTGITQ